MTEAVKALALCHNVTPVVEDDDNHSGEGSGGRTETANNDLSEADRCNRAAATGGRVTYQASSPDEVALVQWSEDVGLTLVDRDLASMKLRAPGGNILSYTILQIFPFTSETKRMGVILQVSFSITNTEDIYVYAYSCTYWIVIGGWVYNIYISVFIFHTYLRFSCRTTSVASMCST